MVLAIRELPQGIKGGEGGEERLKKSTLRGGGRHSGGQIARESRKRML